ncbi:MAG: hypothetical protein R6X17_11780, partial [Candidatus Competibacteraceae bacterium]
ACGGTLHHAFSSWSAETVRYFRLSRCERDTTSANGRFFDRRRNIELASSSLRVMLQARAA